MSKIFNALSTYYDLIYENKDYVGETAYIIELIKKFRPGTKKIVEFGSGTGKHAMLLCENGFQVMGVEPSSEMLEIAKQRVDTMLSFQNDSITSFSSSEQFDVATALFHVISYLNTNEELLLSFKNVHQHLSTDGLFIFDVWYSPAVLSQLPEKRTKIVENELIKVLRNANPINHWNNNVIDVIYDINVQEKLTGQNHQFSETHHMRHFSIPEIELLAQVTGFELLKTEEFGTSEIPGPNTWGVNFILRKK